MSSLLDAATRYVRPDHRMVGIADAVAATAQESVVPGEDFLGVNPNEILIATGQDGMDVHLRLEAWDGPPPPPRDHELSETTGIDLPTGQVCIDLTLRGWIPEVLELPPGHYQARITAWDRTRIKDLYWEVGSRTGFDPGNTEFAALRAGSHGHQRYLVQLWKLGDINPEPAQPEEPEAEDTMGTTTAPAPRRRSATRPQQPLPAPPPSLDDMLERERKHPRQ
ncbi:hypothetical protein DPM19_11980 [Actinomadura craniellae]|uniref:Uncharacterized protein n=1 Tax=Actinomadura craniellae TaxID=2231787 RepID=A0A365H8H3_9ACTN|nr:hypothetical protein [Actinomadura craniellae]RAY15405.1 hypothetical protein DPM19_11980 [Actinomadura craniellae]